MYTKGPFKNKNKKNNGGGGGGGGALGMHLVCCHQEVSDEYVAWSDHTRVVSRNGKEIGFYLYQQQQQQQSYSAMCICLKKYLWNMNMFVSDEKYFWNMNMFVSDWK